MRCGPNEGVIADGIRPTQLLRVVNKIRQKAMPLLLHPVKTKPRLAKRASRNRHKPALFGPAVLYPARFFHSPDTEAQADRQALQLGACPDNAEKPKNRLF